MSRRRIVVVGGGLTGLATAWHLRDTAEVQLLEADARVGGQIRTVEHAGARLDAGADAFLVRQPAAERLARAAGLGDEDLVAATGARAQLWVRGRLRPLPEDTVMGVPTRLRALARSGVLPPAGLARAAIEPLLPARRRLGPDASVADVVGARYGQALVDVLVEPLLGGVYAGAADRLSCRSTAPAVWEVARRHRSLTAGLRRRRASSVTGGPVFMTLRGGLERLVERLATDLGDRLHTARAAWGLRRDASGSAWELATEQGTLVADDVVLAVPAAGAARLLEGLDRGLADELRTARTAGVAVALLAYDRRDTAGVPRASGYLVPRTARRLVKAATFSSMKWPHHAAHEAFLVRASVGRVDDQSALALDDDALLERVDAEVRLATGIRAPARRRRLVRWPAALPQYDVGHEAWLARVERRVAAAPPGLHLAGAAYRGVGLAARATEAEQLAARLGADLPRH